ncbi:MAG: ATP-binding protein [Candidatus Omnitrophota bacterium]
MGRNGKGFLSFITVLILGLCIPAFSQNTRDLGIPFIRNFTAEDCQADFENWGIVRDQRGVMYFANGAGVLEFDGIYWNLIKLANNSDARSIAIDQNGTIFVGGVGEIGYLASNAKGKLTYVSLLDKVPKEDRGFPDVWSTFTTRTQGTYFITPRKIFHWHNGIIRVLPIGMGPMDGAFIGDDLFITTEDQGICVLRGDTVIPLPRCEKLFPLKYGSISILPYPHDQLLIVTGIGKFFLYDLKKLRDPVSQTLALSKKEVPESILKPFASEISEYVTWRHHILHRGRALTGNRYALTTVTGGMAIMGTDGRLIGIINKASGLIDNAIWDVYEDDNRNLWVATNNGIAYVETGCPITRFDDAAGLTGYAQTITRFGGKLFAFTYGGILYLPEYKFKLENDNHAFVSLSPMKGECNAFFQFKNHLLTVVEDNLLQVDGHLRFKTYPAFYTICFGWTKKFPDIVFMGLARGHGLGWIRILDSDTGKNNEIRLIYNGKFKGVDASICKIVSDANGDLWLTSDFEGIFHLQFEGNDMGKYRVTHYTTAQGLPANNWNYVHFFKNRLLVATTRGVYEGVQKPGQTGYRFEPEKTFGRVIPPKYRELVNLVTDEHGTIWINSRSGIGTLHPRADGSYQWNRIPFKKIPGGGETLFLDQQGIVWATATRGIFRFDSHMPKNYRVPFNALIRKVAKAKNAVIFGGTYVETHSRAGESVTVSSLRQPPTLIPALDYKDNSMVFEFSATCYEHAQENRFKYILEGFDKGWSDWTPQPQKEYTNLPEGHYRFRVIARNIYDHLSREAAFAFTIYPPWYRTIPAYLAWAVLIGSFICGFVKLYLLRRESERNLRESEEKFRVLAEQSVVGICILQERVIQYANPRLHEIFQCAPGTMVGKNLLDWAKEEEDRDLVALNLDIQTIDPSKSDAFEFGGITGSGNAIHLEGRGTQTQYRRKPALLETIIDVSERKKAEEELMQSRKIETVGILSGGIAHDFNNLLSIILGNLSFIKDESTRPVSELKKNVNAMETASLQAAELVKNFLTLSRGYWGDFKKLSLADLLKSIENMQPQDIPFEASIPDDLKPIYGDEREIRQVMTNLLANAYEAQNKTGSIRIRTQNISINKTNPWNLKAGDYVNISVIDSGKGILPHHMDKVFDPYFSTKPRGVQKGMGMGLAICHAIVKKHKGHIAISSELGRGTVVDVFLPSWELWQKTEEKKKDIN